MTQSMSYYLSRNRYIFQLTCLSFHVVLSIQLETKCEPNRKINLLKFFDLELIDCQTVPITTSLALILFLEFA